ncbi:MAG: hypothetical protein K2N42_00770, partial [Anaeroplasmataceae bacterium]|nr:hypothetical protein [Anaeroplasmataceae bacterium]
MNIMKKFILGLCVLLGLVSLTACDDDTTIHYVDKNGEEATLNVYATEDKEIIQTVLDFASKANYNDVTSFTLKQSASINASFSKAEEDSFFGLESKKVSGYASMTLNASKMDGFDISLSADLSLSKDAKASFKADALYDGALENMLTSNEYIYVNAKYDVNSPSNFSKGDEKLAYDPKTILDEMEDDVDDIFSKFFPTDVPSIEDPDFTLDEFYENFKNSKLVISKVKNGVIYLDVTLSLKDILSQVDDDDLSYIKDFMSLNSDFVFTFGIEASTGRLCEFSFLYDDVKSLNTALDMFLGYYKKDLIDTFRVEGKVTIEYNKAKIRTLSDAEKAKYALAS